MVNDSFPKTWGTGKEVYISVQKYKWISIFVYKLELVLKHYAPTACT